MELSFNFVTSSIIFLIANGNYIESRCPIPNNRGNDPIFPKYAAKYGHPAEEIDVVTGDGYILKLYHIPGNKTRPVLLIHGNTPTSDCWIIRGEASPAITLAKRGYDVWAINLRGSRYSRRHRFLDPNTQAKRFFNFTFHEQAVYDLPATIDLILHQTGQPSLLAIGHSLGTTQLYVMGAERPEYNDKIRLGISLAPICYLEHVRGLASLGPLIWPIARVLLEKLGIHEFFDHDSILPLTKAFCFGSLGTELCRFLFFTVVGFDLNGLEPEFMAPFWSHFPGGTSTKLLEHIYQLKEKKEFTKYDYGVGRNFAIYGDSAPPQYDLSKVTMKSALFVGREDFLGTVHDSKRLLAALPNVVHYQVMPYEHFSHLNFAWDRYMPLNLYPYLFAVIEKHV